MNREKVIMYLVKLINSGRKTIENVALEYRQEVEEKLAQKVFIKE